MSRKQRQKRKRAKAQGASARTQRAAFLVAEQKMGGGKTLRNFPSGRPLDHVIMAGGATRMPCICRLVEAVTGVSVYQHVDPDEAVARGTAIYAGIMDGDVEIDVLTAWQAAVLRAEADFNFRSKQKENKEGGVTLL